MIDMIGSDKPDFQVALLWSDDQNISELYNIDFPHRFSACTWHVFPMRIHADCAALAGPVWQTSKLAREPSSGAGSAFYNVEQRGDPGATWRNTMEPMLNEWKPMLINILQSQAKCEDWISHSRTGSLISTLTWLIFDHWLILAMP